MKIFSTGFSRGFNGVLKNDIFWKYSQRSFHGVLQMKFFENTINGVLMWFLRSLANYIFWKYFQRGFNGVLKMIFFENILNGVLTGFWKIIFFENIINGVLTGFGDIKKFIFQSQRVFNGVCSKTYKISHFEETRQ